jgi:high-affinity nickel permease
MLAQLNQMFRWPATFRQPIASIYTLLILANMTAWAWAVLAFRDQPVLLGTALLAYGFGLRPHHGWSSASKILPPLPMCICEGVGEPI